MDIELILIQLLLALGVFVICYLIAKNIVRKELEKSIPAQIKAAQELFGNKEVRLILKINSKGESEFEHFEIIKEADSYVG